MDHANIFSLSTIWKFQGEMSWHKVEKCGCLSEIPRKNICAFCLSEKAEPLNFIADSWRSMKELSVRLTHQRGCHCLQQFLNRRQRSEMFNLYISVPSNCGQVSYRIAMNVCEATNQGGTVASFKFVKAGAVHQACNDLPHLKSLSTDSDTNQQRLRVHLQCWNKETYEIWIKFEIFF